MSAVKRVQKLLRQAEKRATANINLEDTRKTEQQKLAELAKAADKREEVYIKATGRAIEKALKVGKWFEEKDSEYGVRVTTGSVLAVDDIVEDDEKRELDMQKECQSNDESAPGKQDQETPKTAGKKKKRKAPAASDDAELPELPESRTRWVKMVEVAVSLK
jgi:ribonuclease P/MRP protein subunit POP7